MTKIGIISAYPKEDWDAQRIAEAAERHGSVELLAPVDFGAQLDGDFCRVTVRSAPATKFDLFLTPRAVGEQGDAEFQIELYQLLAEEVPLVNDVCALVTAIDKLKSSWRFAQAGLHTPRVIVAQRLEEACRALIELREAVVKPVYGSLGIGVEKLGLGDAARMRELLAQHRVIYLQAYVEPRADVRVFVVGDRVEAAIMRRAAPGEFRSNIHQGADFELFTPDATTADLAVRATRAVGLDYAGVDILLTDGSPQLLEVNGTPSFRAVNAASGRDMAEAIVAHAVETAARRRLARGDAQTRFRPRRLRDHARALRRARGN